MLKNKQTHTHTHTNKGTKRDLCYMISHSNIEKSLRRHCYLKNKSKKNEISVKYLCSKEENNKNRNEKQRKCFYPFYVYNSKDVEKHKGKIHIFLLSVLSERYIKQILNL